MPRAPWRRRSTTDSPRPAGRGRRWTGRLRRSAVARRVLRVRHRQPAEPYRAPAEPYRAPAEPHRGPAEPHRRHWSRPIRRHPRTAATIPALTAGPATPDLAPAVAAAPISLLPGERTVRRQLRFVLVNACTLASLSLGVLAILLAMRGDVRSAAFCLIACVAFDGLDGLLARRLGVASPFGSQMDSLADMCAFGIAAPVVVYASIASEWSGGAAGEGAGGTTESVPPAAAAVACALVAACAAIRLARFNISPKDSRFFSGVPTTMAAAVLAVAVLIDLPLSPTVLLCGVAVLAFAMVSGFPYATLARLLRLPLWLWLAPLVGALVDARLTFVALVAAYLVSGPVLWLRHRRAAAA
ncbi:MAG: CDP-alcohol phosphatidyltransferase [Micromonosporaceae bacterium]|nr:CDP-alcohol phosphatidyltransferase [Micromonosporaceae bacterium]